MPVWAWIVVGVVLAGGIGGALSNDDEDISTTPGAAASPAATSDDRDTGTAPDDGVTAPTEPESTEAPNTTTATTSPETTEPTSTTSTSTTTSTTTTSTTTTSTTTTTTTTLPPFEPIELSGTGPDVVTFDPPLTDIYIARASHSGSSNFQVTLLDDRGDRITGLVNEIGNYSGKHAVNFRGNDEISFVEVNADGAWELVFDDVLSAPMADTTAGSEYTGEGTDVIIFLTDGPTTVEIECIDCESNFQVTAWGDSRRGLVNEIGQFTGRVLVPADNLVLEIYAGPGFRSETNPTWRIDVE